MLSLSLGLSLTSGQGGSGLESETLFTETLTAGGAINDTTAVVVIDVSGFTPPDFTVTHARLIIQGTVGEIYIGEQAASGEAYDAASLTQAFFGGNAGVSQDGTETTQTDLIEFAWDKTDNIIVSLWSGSGAIGQTSASNNAISYASLHFTGSANEASDAVKTTGYTVLTTDLYYVKEIIFYGS